MIVIIDYGVGNLGSIRNMLNKIGVEGVISSETNIIDAASKLILPGVGAFGYGIKKLNDSGIIKTLEKKVLGEKTPILGICLGAQLFTRRSEEGRINGLGWFDAETVKFDFGNNPQNLKIPHMGWSDVTFNPSSRLFTDMYSEPRFYFVHAYHLKTIHKQEIVATSVYGHEFCSGMERDNIVGVQFHPEKSHKFGMRILKNFVELY